MKNKKTAVVLCSVLVVIIAVFAALIIINKPKTNDRTKNISVTVVYSNKNEKKFDINTESEFLGDAVFEKGLVTEEEHKSGFYTVIDGETADFNSDKAFWSVTKDGEWLNVGMNEQPIADGEKYEITYTKDNS